MVDGINNVSIALSGSGIKEPSRGVKKQRSIRKSLYYKNSLDKGTKLKENHFVALRPADGISPMKIDLFIDKS